MKRFHVMKVVIFAVSAVIFSVNDTLCQVPSRDNFNIIFENNFEDNTTGRYVHAEYLDDWNLPSSSSMHDKEIIDIVSDSDPLHKKVMRGYYWEGTFSDSQHGFLWRSYFSPYINEVYFSYDVKFREGFEWVMGGKLPGVTGGKIVPGLIPSESDGFSARPVWKEDGKVALYVYHQDQTGDYGSMYYFNNFHFETNRWYNVTIRVVLNTISNGTAANNGIVEGYIDGKLYFVKKDLKYRSLESIKIDNMYISSFFGGASAVWAATRDDWMDSDNYIAFTYSDRATNVARGNTANSASKLLLHPYYNFSNIAEQPVTPVIPGAPTVFNSSEQTDKSISLTWVDNSSNELGFKLERSDNPSKGYQLISTISGNIIKYTDTGLEPDKMYYYRLRAFNEQGESSFIYLQQSTSFVDNVNAIKVGYSEVFSNSSGASNRRALPVNMTESGTINSISIYHNGGSGNAILGIYSTSEALPGQRIALTNPSPVNSSAGWQTFQLTSPVEVSKGSSLWLAWVFEDGISLRYTSGEPGRAQSADTYAGGMPEVFGTSAVSASVYSIYASYIPKPVSAEVPDAPTNLHLVAKDPVSATIGWTDNAQNENGFEIERLNTADDTRKTFGTAGNIISLLDEGLTENTTYQYRIRAFNDAGSSTWTDLLTVITPEPEKPVVEQPVDPQNNLPVISNQQFNISEQTLQGNVLGTIAATDPDGHQLTYAIVSENPNGLFSINSLTGQLNISNKNVFGPGTLTFQLTVRVTDNAPTKGSSSATVTIRLTGNSNTVYIDPDNAGDPLANGSFEHPYDSWSNVTWKSGYSYLQKRGTTTTVDKILIGANQVTLGAYGEGELPVIKSNTSTYLVSGFEKAGITISQLNLQAPNAVSSIYFLGNTGDSTIVEYCQLNANVNAIKVANGNKLVVRYNTISSNFEGVYSSAADNQVYYNIFKNCQEGVNIMGNSAIARISNNVFFNNEESLSVTYADLTLFNNIFYMDSPGQKAISFGSGNLQSNNNIYYPEQAGFITVANNVYNSLEQLQQALNVDMNSFISDPVFVDMYNDNFLLAENSPAINAGIDLNLGIDLLGSSVPLSGAADIGVHEFTGIIAPQEDAGSHSLRLYPNPSNGKFNVLAEIPAESAGYDSEISQIRVIDLTGKTVFTRQLEQINETTYHDQIDLTGIANGMYMVVVEMAGKLAQEKLMINR